MRLCSPPGRKRDGEGGFTGGRESEKDGGEEDGCVGAAWQKKANII